MTPILTLTLNPALDLATQTAEVIPGPKLRCTAPRVDPGGGGINVARAIRILGGTARALVALGGTTGQRLAQALKAEGIAHTSIAAPGETRESFAVTETNSGQQFRFVLPGAEWARVDIDHLLEMTRQTVPEGAFVVMSGSQPPGVPARFAAAVQAALPQGARLVLDTSGPALHAVVDQPIPGLALLRMDDAEAEELAGRRFADRRDAADFAAGLVARGVAQRVIVARGAEGSVLADGAGRLFGAAPRVEVVSAVGAGDTFVGALVLALARGEPRDCALAQGVAAAAAACITPATELCHAEDVVRLLTQVNVETL
ncbi:6-phosphofructokinase [Gemmobacter aquatilis]|uniref:Phosphofructokinase n=1 Tax=Gemmobacter aquatilis TaxID=933059 RepID=A0A1H8IRG7_9RHOB|nr:1-phosphofructokinase family hexose kinase [Gemmobacter aquatilis]SEN71154.1 6-phosphofructokinase [Gemmobacter aquatilis]